MATPVIMPRQGQSVESCLIGSWHKQKGDQVEVDDLLFTYETDKATFDEKAKTAGILLDVFFEEGDDVPVLANVCVIGAKGEDTSSFDPRKQQPVKQGEPADQETAASSARVKTRSGEVQEKTSRSASPEEIAAGPQIRKASPRARKLALETGTDLEWADGSGPMGRIIERDIRNAASPEISGKTETKDNIVPHSGIRKIIAKTMHGSLAEMAQLTLNSSFDATDIINLRSKLKQAQEQQRAGAADFAVPTFNDIVLYAVSRVLERHPECNAWYDKDKLTLLEKVNLGVAIDTPRGLMVPTIFDAGAMDIGKLSRTAREIAADCRKGDINPDLLRGATFTVTNLGTLGIESFTPVINPPQTCILGLCSIVTRVRMQDGALTGYPAAGLSLTFDHRALDGAPAARFLNDLVRTLEDFSLLLLQESTFGKNERE